LIAIVGGSLPFLLFFTGLSLASAPSAAFIHKTLFIWVAFLAVPFLGERLGWAQICALGVLLGTFMGGMCIGSLALSRVVSSARHPLRVYAYLELGIGIFGLLELYLIPLVNHVYVASVGHGMPSIMLRAVVAAACLLPPTLLMGATLPAISRYVQSRPRRHIVDGPLLRRKHCRRCLRLPAGGVLSAPRVRYVDHHLRGRRH